MASSSCSSINTSSSLASSAAAMEPDLLIVEPFYCGSHKQLVDCLVRDEVIRPKVHLVTMSGKKWHWRARVSALHLTTAIPVNHHFRVLLSSSVLNLAELVALRPDLASLHKVLYFHENQLQYPVRKQKDRDFQYGYNQILSCLVADSVLFNSAFNMESFLSSITSFLKLIPDYRPKGLPDLLRPKCCVVYFPVQYPDPFNHQANHHTQYSKPMLPAQVKSLPNTHPKNMADSQLKAVQNNPTFPADYVHGVNQNPNKFASQDILGKEADEDKAFMPWSAQVDSLSSGDAFSQPGPAHSSTDLRSPADCSVRTEVLNPQAKMSRQDFELAACLDEEGERCLKFQHQDTGDEGDFWSRAVRQDSCSSAFSGSCGRGSFTLGDVGTEAGGTLSAAVSSSGGHAQRRGQDHPSLDKPLAPPRKKKDGCLHIVWPHRWEHDKDPETFFQALFRLQDEELPFVVSVLGETFTDVPDIFAEAEHRLKGRVCTWGYQSEKADYFLVLQQADVVVSTAKHEFFGVAMLEAVSLGCYPLCPRTLVYPELYPDECLYSTSNQLYKRLRTFCLHPHLPRDKPPQMDLQRFSWEALRPVFLSKLRMNMNS